MRVTFVHGRPGPHPLHLQYGVRVADRVCFVDPWLRWHDISTFAPWRYICWLVNSLYFVTWKKKVVLTEGLHITLVLSKLLSFGNLKLICLADDESAYFVTSRYYKGLSHIANRLAYRRYDGFICIGRMMTALVTEINTGRHPVIATGFNGINNERLARLVEVKPMPGSLTLICIANGPGSWRAWYKGIDLLLDSFARVAQDNSAISLKIIGQWDDEEIKRQTRDLAPEIAARIHFLGYNNNIESLLAVAGFCIHVGRGEAWGIGPTEAMAAGVPAMVSEWTGSKEVVEKVDPKLVVPLSAGEIADRLRWYLTLPLETKNDLSRRSRKVAAEYPASKAIDMFENNFRNIVARFA